MAYSTSFLLFGILFCGMAAAKSDFNVIDKLYGVLMADYNKHIRPVANHSQTLTVGVGITAMRIDADEKKKQFYMDAFYRQEWKDERLSWNPDDYDGLKMIAIPDNQVWKPDTTLYNNIEYGTQFDIFSPVSVVVWFNGTVLYVPATQLRTTCYFDLRRWPLDQQKCKLKMGSWVHNGKLINYKLDANSVALDNIEAGNGAPWKLVESSIEVINNKYECCEEAYPTIDVIVTIQRNAPMYRMTIMVPASVIVVLTLATFFLPPLTSSKFFIGLLNFLILCLYLIYFNFTFPAGGHVPLIVSFFSASAVMVGTSVLISVVIMNWIKCGSSGPSDWLMRCLAAMDGFPCSLCPIFPSAATARAKGAGDSENRLAEKNESSAESKWIALALAFERLAFLIFLVVFVALITELHTA